MRSATVTREPCLPPPPFFFLGHLSVTLEVLKVLNSYLTWSCKGSVHVNHLQCFQTNSTKKMEILTIQKEVPPAQYLIIALLLSACYISVWEYHPKLSAFLSEDCRRRNQEAFICFAYSTRASSLGEFSTRQFYTRIVLKKDYISLGKKPPY